MFYLFFLIHSLRDLETLSDDEALFAELENEEDNDLSVLREKRIKEIQDEINRRAARSENNHGLYTDITKEKEFMDITTSEKYVVGHFYHKDFRRCKIMDTHLEKLAKKYYDARFIKIDVQNAPFLVEKLQVRVLPCVIAWVDGYAQTKIVGFDALGNTDSFQTAALELKLIHAGVIKKKEEKVQNKKKSIFQSSYDTDSELEDD
ncbi:thioredoxin-like protein [Cokeromyces recurvatus]|uniref:thioredoxin-like protein n=1 Tax=Cokeromyces recurvatus TaxID=90255 RepID=UPI00221F679E|nr:thioredoxin-like protein [Cokeromyces recurvatus]KAI7900436.1 thioredoxin-like protein [Cokeromyces recurvatus]